MEGISKFSSNPIEAIDWFVYIIILGVLFVLIVTMIYFFYRKQKNRSPVKSLDPATTPKQRLIEMDQFAKEGEYRWAIQACFHYLLEMLTRNRDMFFAQTKTNGEYRQDFQQADPKGAEIFQNLSFYFDEVWYGEKTIDEEDYLRYRRDVLEFVGEVELDEKR